MKRFLIVGAVTTLALGLGGCDQDHRGTQAKLHSATPDITTRNVMVCPVCGAPQRPYRVNRVQSFYRCTGLPPKFEAHDLTEWTHDISHSPDSLEQ